MLQEMGFTFSFSYISLFIYLCPTYVIGGESITDVRLLNDLVDTISKNVPLRVPRRTSNDVYMNPCKAVAFAGDIALTDEDVQQGLSKRIPSKSGTDEDFLNSLHEHVRDKGKLERVAKLCSTIKRKQYGRRARTCALLQKYHEERRKRGATSITDRLWDHGVIPYEIESNFTDVTPKSMLIFEGDQKTLFKLAMRHWENSTCLNFVERRPEDQNYVFFTRTDCGCCSSVGKRNGPQGISIGKNCDRFGIVVHEIGHAIGFWHEHMRPDRDEHVQIIFENIQPDTEYNFKKHSLAEVDSLGEEYDYDSIMHYGRATFAKDSFGDTIVPHRKAGSFNRPRIGQRHRLSPGDIRQTNKLYKCPSCGRTLQEPSGSFSYSPEGRNHHFGKACHWRISASHGEKIVLNLTSLDIPRSRNCRYAYLEVRDGFYEGSPLLGKFCGYRVPPTLTSTANRMWLQYRSARGRGKGFVADYEAICGGEIHMEKGQISSPNYPFDYAPNKVCVWKITVSASFRVALKFQSSEIENHAYCHYDYLEVRDGHDLDSPVLGRFCGYKIPDHLQSTSNKMTVKFVSDGTVHKSGFSASFIEEYDECSNEVHNCDHICVNTLGSFRCECEIGFELQSDGKSCTAACGGYIHSSQGTIHSPYYPDLYPPGKTCVWQIVAPVQHRVTLNFTHFDLEGDDYECQYDTVTIESGAGDEVTLHGEFCGLTLPSVIISRTSTLLVKFISDGSVQKTGFHATFFTEHKQLS